MELKTIAKIYTGFDEKFGIPRQSGMVDVPARIVFEPDYRDINAIRGLEGFSHIWVLWEFSKAKSYTWQPTVRPPRLGGNKRMGVFATRSPFRPNSIGLSSLRLLRIEKNEALGAVLHVSGADILNGTPIFDIKPYIAFTDSHPDAVCGFSEEYKDYKLEVLVSDILLNRLPDELKQPLIDLLANDPRPSYQHNSERVYGVSFFDYEIKFTVNNMTLTVTDINKR